jgi:tetratricopeptide (TPR) repeat protein
MRTDLACPDSATLIQFLLGKLAEAEIARVQQHLEECPRCAELATGLRVSDEFLHALNGAVQMPASAGDAGRSASDRVGERDTHADADASPHSDIPMAGASTWSGTPAGTADGPVADASLEPLALRRRRIGGYQLLETLGAGGMGVVYKAWHTALQREVAIKMVRAVEGAAPHQLARFRAEAQAVAQLQHPHIVQVYDTGEHESASGTLVPFMVLEYVPGCTLHEAARQNRYTPTDAARLTATLARAVHAAHQRGVVHRDLKPANVLVGPGGVPKITDFGLAKRCDESFGPTRTGQIVGTPQYMAPEQAQGTNARVGPAADIYALGAILYELLCGVPPFTGDSPLEILDRVRIADPVAPRRLVASVPPDLESICLKCIEKVPQHRYESAAALADDLQRYLAGESVRARPWGKLRRWTRALRRRRAALVAAVILVLSLCGTAIVTYQLRETRMTAAAQRDFDDALKLSQWTAEDLRTLDRCVERLERVHAGEVSQAKQRLAQQWRQALLTLLDQPRLDDDHIARYEWSSRLLADRAPHYEPELRSAFQQRLRRWETRVEWTRGQADWQTWFEPGVVAMDDGFLTLDPTVRPPEIGSTRGTTTVPSRIRVVDHCECEVAFDESWETARELGICLLRGDGRDGYVQGLVSTGEGGSGEGPLCFGDARRAGNRLLAQIVRDGVRQREVRLSAPPGPLVLRVRRADDRIEFQVAGTAPVAFLDPFPARPADGRIALRLPSRVRISRLTFRRQPLPPLPSPLERGDALLADQKPAEAYDAYQAQLAGAADSETAQEARYKSALCLQGMLRAEDAATIWEQLLREPGRRWPAMAACQLWLLRLQQDRMDESEVVFSYVNSHFAFEDLVTLLPDEARYTILSKYAAGSPAAMIWRRRQFTERAERAVHVADFLHIEPLGNSRYNRWGLQQALLRANLFLGRPQRAIDVGRDWFDRCRALPTRERMIAVGLVLIDYAWLLGTRGEAGQALEELDRWLYAAPGVLVEETPIAARVLLERVRLHAARDDWDGAAGDLRECFRLLHNPAIRADYVIHATAHLLDGFLHERRGDAAGARTAWRAGTYAAWKDQVPRQAWLDPVIGPNFDSRGLFNLMMAALSDSPTDAAADEFVDGVVATLTEKPLLQQMIRMARLPRGTFGRMWTTPRGRDCARRIAFHEIAYPEYMTLPLLLAGSEVLLTEAFDGQPTPAEAELVWKLCQDGLQLLADERLDWVKDSSAMFITWNGLSSGGLSWSALAPKLPGEVRGPAAFVLGRRYVRLGRPAEAQSFFQTALQESNVGSAVHRFAQDGLQRLALPQPEK